MYIHNLADDLAIVSARYNRFKSNESVLEEISAIYTLLKDDGLGWKIVAIITHDADKLIGKK